MTTTKPNTGPRLTWDDIANIYDKATGSTARTQPMDRIFEWAAKQTNKFFVDEDGYIYQILP